MRIIHVLPSVIRTNNTGVYGAWGEQMRNPDMYGDTGGASRFYKQVGGGKVSE